MATVIFTEGAIASQLADTGWADMKADLSTKPCSGGGAHTYVEALKPFGLNPRDPAFWTIGTKRLERLVDQFEALG